LSSSIISKLVKVFCLSRFDCVTVNITHDCSEQRSSAAIVRIDRFRSLQGFRLLVPCSSILIITTTDSQITETSLCCEILYQLQPQNTFYVEKLKLAKRSGDKADFEEEF